MDQEASYSQQRVATVYMSALKGTIPQVHGDLTSGLDYPGLAHSLPGNSPVSTKSRCFTWNIRKG
jgi:hypothetical protein